MAWKVFAEDAGTGLTNQSDRDFGDGANFTALGHNPNATDFSPSDPSITADFTVPDATFSEAQYRINVSNVSTRDHGSGAITWPETTFPVYAPQTTVALTDSAVNEIFVAIDLTTSGDDGRYVVTTDGSSPTDPSIKVAEIDTSANTVTSFNTRPDGNFSSLDVQGSVSASGTATFGGGGRLETDRDLRIGGTDSSNDHALLHDSSNDRIQLIEDPDNARTVVMEHGQGGAISFPNYQITFGNGAIARSAFKMESWTALRFGDGNEWSAYYNNSNLLFSGPGGTTLDLGDSGSAQFPNASVYHGNDPRETITETSSPTGFTFSGSSDRDIHDWTDVTLSNSSSSSVTEDVTVDLYDGVDNTGTLIASGTQSISVASGSSKTVTFLTADQELDTGDYYLEVTTSGTTLAVDQTEENTKGGEYEIGQTTVGDLYIDNQDNDRVLAVDAITDAVDIQSGQLSEQGNRVATRLWANNGNIDAVNLDGSSGTSGQVLETDGTTAQWTDMSVPVDSVFGRTGAVTAQSDDYSASQITNFDSSARSAIEAGNVDHVQFSNIEDVSSGQIGRDNSIGFLGSWGGNGTAVLWDSYNVNAGNQISISGGTGSESNPTIAVSNNPSFNSVTVGSGELQLDEHVDFTGGTSTSPVIRTQNVNHVSFYDGSNRFAKFTSGGYADMRNGSRIGVPYYASESDLPAGNEGDIAYVSGTGSLYVYDGS